MRRLMWFAIGYGAVCAVGAYLLRGWGLLIFGCAALAMSIGVFCLRKYPVCRRLAAVLLGIALGSAAFWSYDYWVITPAAILDGTIQPTTVYVTDYSYETDYGSAADGVILIEGREYKVRVYFNEKVEAVPGDIFRFDGRFRLTDVDGEKEPTYHRADGVLLLCYQRSDAVLVAHREVLLDRAALWRHQLQEIIGQAFPSDTAAFAKGLLLGDTTDFSYEQTMAFSVSGISHIVAVSGLHVSILCSVVYLFSGRRRVLTALLGIPVLLVFAALVGFTASVTRAVIMQILMMVATLVNREYDPPTALSFAVVAMLTECPLVIASVGFQLSVGSVAGIFLFFTPIQGWLKKRFPGKGKTLRGRAERWFINGVAVTFSATVVTTPLTALYFHTVSLVSPLTNLLVLFAVSGIFCGIGLVCILGFIHMGAAQMAAWVISWPIRYVLGVAELLAEFPLAAVYTESEFVVMWLVGLYLLLGWLLWSKKKRPGVAAALACVGLMLALAMSWWDRWDYRLTVLDVGQGQCILLQSEGRTFLVDCGGSSDEQTADLAAQTLMSQGVFRIDGLILTHYDRDHAGGVEYLAKRVEVDRLYLPETEDADGLLERVAASCETHIPISEQVEISFGEAQIILYPAKNSISGNDSSASVLFRWGKYDTLITGDLSSRAELQLLADYELPDLEVLLVGHHGSKNSTSSELLEATKPEVAIISVGSENPYGHPTDEVLERLQEAGCMVYRTDLHGTIFYRR